MNNQFNPMNTFKQFYDMNAESMESILQRWMASKSFATMLGGQLDSYLYFQEQFQKYVEKYLETMKIPSQNDLARIAGLIIAVESKVDEMSRQLECLKKEVVKNRKSSTVTVNNDLSSDKNDNAPSKGPEPSTD